jgi:hypothetical protein
MFTVGILRACPVRYFPAQTLVTKVQWREAALSGVKRVKTAQIQVATQFFKKRDRLLTTMCPLP